MEKIGLISDWVYLYKQHIPKDLYSELQYTTVVQDDGVDYEETHYLMEDVDENIVAIPRYCSYSKELLEMGALNDVRTEGADIDIKINVPPRDHFQEDAINSIVGNEHGIICAKTAFGKTYVAINAISRLKKRALILMHKRDLMYQWKDDILRYTNLKDEDVQIFTGSKFERGKAITITTVQNICAKIRNEKEDIRQIVHDENFGITFYDECHTTVGPQANTQSSRWVFSKRIYGLSATPARGDDMDNVIKCILGNIIYTDSRKMLPVYVSFAPFHIDVPGKTVYYLNYSQKQYTLRYNKWLSKQDKYLDYCSNLLLGLIKADRKILAVAALKDLLTAVYEKTYSLLGDNHINVDKIRVVHGTSEASFDGVKTMTKDEIKNFNCIFSTNKFFSEGLSINWLDTIVYLTAPSARSLSSIPQLVGRVVREYEGKEYVLVVDAFNNSFQIEQIRYSKRVDAYRNLGYHVLPLQNIESANRSIEDAFSTISHLQGGGKR